MIVVDMAASAKVCLFLPERCGHDSSSRNHDPIRHRSDRNLMHEQAARNKHACDKKEIL